MKKYIPNPVNTEQIQLPKELEYLVEEMAKNVHEVWSKTRIEQGWTYGEKRDDVLKQHPAFRHTSNLVLFWFSTRPHEHS